MSDERTSFDAAFERGMEAVVTPRDTADGNEYVLLPEGTRAHGLEWLKDAPNRPRGATTAHTAKAFTDLVNRHASERSIIYCHRDAGRFDAVFNDHSPDGTPGWRDWRAHYGCPVDRDFKRWRDLDGEWIDQRAFAEEIESLLPTISDPPGADLLEAAQSFNARINVAYTQGSRLNDGSVDLQYKEEIEDQGSSRGSVRIPSRITLLLPVYRGQDARQVDVRVRYRIEPNSRQLRLMFVLDRVEDVIDEAFTELMDEVQSAVTRDDVLMVMGAAPTDLKPINAPGG